MRPLLLPLAAAVALAACDSSSPEEEDVLPRSEFWYSLITPSSQDTLRLGQPFDFRAEVEADLGVDSMGVVLNYLLDEEFREIRFDLFSVPVTRPGEQERFTVNRTLTIDTLYGIAGLEELDPAGRFTIGMYGYTTGRGGREGGGALIVVVD